MTARDLDDALLAEALSYDSFVFDQSDENRSRWYECRRRVDSLALEDD